jgi:hypothetical protein
MRWVDCHLFVLLSCCPYRGLVKALLIATHSPESKKKGCRVAEQGMSTGPQWIWLWQPVAELGRVAQLGRVFTVDIASAACCRTWPCRVAQLGRVCTVNFALATCCTALQRVAHLGRVCTANFAFAACCTAWPRVAQLCSVYHSLAACAQRILHLHRVAQLGRVLHTFAACITAWPRVHSEFRICSVLHSLAACCTPLQRVAQLGRACTANVLLLCECTRAKSNFMRLCCSQDALPHKNEATVFFAARIVAVILLSLSTIAHIFCSSSMI